jgi:signal transduction histidine kinase
MGALSLEKEWCDLREIVDSPLSHVGRTFAGRHVRTVFEQDLPLIYVDYLQVKRVLYNLLENAARHNPEEEDILVSAQTVSLEMPGETSSDGALRCVRVRVVDHGGGVPEEERERIFKSFYSLDGHSGLGLAICRGIIEAHHGRIWVEPAPGGGARFVFVLPVSS